MAAGGGGVSLREKSSPHPAPPVPQSSFAPERATTSFHFAVSLAIVSAKSFGVPPAGSSPIMLNRSRNPGDRIARLTAALSFSRIAGGRPAGPIRPVQVGAL